MLEDAPFRAQGGWRGAVSGLLALALVPFLAGCQAYEPLPLTAGSAEAALRPVDPETLRVRAAALQHPILRPVEIDPRQGLTPEAARILAVLGNPALRAVRDRRALAEAQLLDAGLLPNPRLSYDLEALTGGDTSGKVNAFGVGVSWDVTSLVGAAARREAARSHRDAVDLGVAWSEWQVALAAEAAVYRLASLERQLPVAEEAVQDAAGRFDLIRRAVSEGTETEADLATARDARQKAAATLVDVRGRAQRARLLLNRLLGLPSDSPIRLRKGLEPPSGLEPPGVSELVAGLERRRLDLVALRKGYESEEGALRAAVLDQFPRIRIGPTHGQDVENVETVGFGIELELPFLQHRQGRAAIETATRQALFDEYADRLFRARSDVATARARIETLKEKIAVARSADRERTKRLEALRSALADGRADAVAVAKAVSARDENRIALFDLEADLASAVVALESASGRILSPAVAGP